MSQDVYARLTKKIIQSLKDGTPPWRKPWAGGHTPMPINAATKRRYTGVNVFSLWMAGEMRGYTSNLWGTEKMWERLGGVPLKNQRPTDVYLFRRIRVADKHTGKKKTITIITVFDVYNLDQIWGCLCLKQQVNPVISAESAINFCAAEEVAECMDVTTIHRGTKACYNLEDDKIMLPPKTRFSSQIGYWSTRFHELIHSTGHPSRLNRTFGKFGSPEYAFEELIAEIGTAFVCSMIGIPEAQDQMPQHASYLSTWLSVLQEDDKAIFKAASAAQKAADFVLTAGEKKS